MTTNDTQIDALMRRHGQRPKSKVVTGHLDADELNAFAEKTLPPATRSRYVSHLAECEDCRKLATQLVLAGSATMKSELAANALASESGSWRQKLSALFAPPMFRYAAFAVVLAAIAAVVFLGVRHNRQEAPLVAENTPATQTQGNAVKENGAPKNNQGPQSSANQ